MRLASALVAAALLLASGVCGQSPADLVGLWRAERWFGPYPRGPLVITESQGVYTADLMGHRVGVRQDRGELTFELPNGQGTFRGKLERAGGIRGHWFSPVGVAVLSCGLTASPVRLRPDGPRRWRGDVEPCHDEFSFYLLVQRRPDGSLRALLRNPERDWAAFLGVERLERDGNVVRLIGRVRGRAQAEPTVVASGSYDPETSVITLGLRGGSYDFRRESDQSEFYPRGRSPGRYAYSPPLSRDDGWPTGTLEDVEIDRGGVEAFIQAILDMPMDSANAPQVHGVLLARHGRLVLEEYFHGEHRDRVHQTRSAAKSMTATIVGAAMRAGTPLSLSSPVYQVMNQGAFPADLEPRKRAMTLEHLLTMTSGFFCDDNNQEAPGREDRMWEEGEDFYQFTLALPMALAPGEKAIYCSANPNLALGMVGRVSRESPLSTFDRLVGDPLGIHRYAWPLDPAGNPFGGGGVQFLPRDFMKLGQLMLNGGTWAGRRILSGEFVTRAASPLYQLGTRRYGYSWWGMDFPYRDRTTHAYAALGNGGNVVLVIPELDVVIALYGANYATPIWRWGEAIPRFILPAVR